MKKAILVTVLSTALLLTGCNAKGSNNQFIDAEGSNTDSGITTYKIIDRDTGCQYMVFDWSGGGGVTELLGRDGEPVCENIRSEATPQEAKTEKEKEDKK